MQMGPKHEIADNTGKKLEKILLEPNENLYLWSFGNF